MPKTELLDVSAGDGTLCGMLGSKFFSGKRIGIGGSSTNGWACCGGKFGGSSGGGTCGGCWGPPIGGIAIGAETAGIFGWRPRRPGVPEESQ